MRHWHRRRRHSTPTVRQRERGPVGLELTRFRGHLQTWGKGVHDGEYTQGSSAGVAAADGGVGAVGAQAGGAVTGVRAVGAGDWQLGAAGGFGRGGGEGRGGDGGGGGGGGGGRGERGGGEKKKAAAGMRMRPGGAMASLRVLLETL